ncbi:hypothetical protein CDD81_1960 [Ophiocordyceps australis]|uniref:BRCT domain-containing protein n=1 Tax=Ophiocordyceps australis TaxID=1399860 RepID=A0A2C5XYH6_9HYPO|nr:hypothetical protein CDD81_1960 [Ophiocordyceps australis]
MDSPPKRMTRARAAAKAKEPTVKSAKSSTAAGRTRTPGTATASTKSTAAKRKTRADDNDNEDEAGETTARRAVRGRAKKDVTESQEGTAESGPSALGTRSTRSRPAKKAAVERTKDAEVAAAPVSAAVRSRGRSKKNMAPEAEEVSKDAARTRVASVPRSNIAGAVKSGVKKTVKFQDMDKENVNLGAKAKQASDIGLRGRPVRRAVQAAPAPSRKTRATSKTLCAEDAEKRPLSPKKVTQMPVARGDQDSSEDELAADQVQTPARPMMMSPVKPPASNKTSAKKSEPVESDLDAAACESQPADDATASGPQALLAASPRRLPSSPLKATLKSPAKRIPAMVLSEPTVEGPMAAHVETGSAALGKPCLLQSAAKRPHSPTKGPRLAPDCVSKSAMKSSMFQSPAKRAIPGFKPFTEPRRPASSLVSLPDLQALALATPTRSSTHCPSHRLMVEEEAEFEEEMSDESIEKPRFNGRLSTVMPRHMDPVLLSAELDAPADEDDQVQLVDTSVAQVMEEEDVGLQDLPDEGDEAKQDGSMSLDDIMAAMEDSGEISRQDAALLPCVVEHGNAAYELRQEVMDPYYNAESDSEVDDEVVAPANDVTLTPARFAKGLDLGSSRRSTLGFTSLTERFGSWAASSPEKTKATAGKLDCGAETPSVDACDMAVESNFFNDEMVIKQQDEITLWSESKALEIQDVDLEQDVMATQEDLCLAQEAHEMSMMDPEQLEALLGGQSLDEAFSEASQEYGDENQAPFSQPAIEVPTTPVGRGMELRCFNTTTKVPLKSAHEPTPSPVKKRSMSASRAVGKRPNTLSRSASVISYSPCKEEMESVAGTPSRTGRQHEVNATLLRGAVVFVDAHTTDGADASGIFIELLNLMGAKCVKSWSWKRNSSSGGEPSKVGITHVVYKDGGKRTLEKVVEAKGLVHCVGVNWVLDCERENKWLDEDAYRIDTRWMPRGGGRRRKSMEPKALVNINGSLVTAKASSCSTAPSTPMNRRDSSLWMFTPLGDEDKSDAQHQDWPSVVLTPVPKTPAAEAVARYAAQLPDDASDMTDPSPAREQLVTRTCPPKQQHKFADLGEGVLGRDKDENVLMRLMAARRKSLQFAPKIGSPLAKTW